MRNILTAFAVSLGMLCMLGVSPCFAQSVNQETANDAFKSVYGAQSPDQQQVNANIALYQYEVYRGTFNPPVEVTNVGTIDETNTYNGPVSNSGATNSVNSSSIYSSVTATNDSSVTLTPNVGQSSGSASQNATSDVLTNSQDNSTISK